MTETITLNKASPEIQYLCKKDKRLAKVIAMVGPISYRIHSDGYAFLIHEIIEQMLSTKAAAKIYSRLEGMCGGNISVDSVSALTDAQIKSIGTATSKVNYIRNVTNAITAGKLNLAALADMDTAAVTKSLTSIKGIGSWTAKMYLIFVLNRQDILPTEDVAFLQAYEWLYKTKDRSKEAVEKRCKKWKPYSSIAARYLYRALDMGFCKSEFHLFK